MSLWPPERGEVVRWRWAWLSLRRNGEWVMATAAQYTSQLMKAVCDSTRIICTFPCHALCSLVNTNMLNKPVHQSLLICSDLRKEEGEEKCYTCLRHRSCNWGSRKFWLKFNRLFFTSVGILLSVQQISHNIWRSHVKQSSLYEYLKLMPLPG